jgi:hypothetical protein
MVNVRTLIRDSFNRRNIILQENTKINLRERPKVVSNQKEQLNLISRRSSNLIILKTSNQDNTIIIKVVITKMGVITKMVVKIKMQDINNNNQQRERKILIITKKLITHLNRVINLPNNKSQRRQKSSK